MKESEKDCHIQSNKANKGYEYIPFIGIPGQKEPVEGLEIPTRLLPYMLDICPIGDGSLYERFVAVTMVKIFGEIIDKDLVCSQIPIEGGLADIELPFCSEILPHHSHWIAWYNNYGVKTILVEVKNLKTKATNEHAAQLKNYVDGNRKGRLAFLISRSGFTQDALKTLKSYTFSNYLLLPLEHRDLRQLIKLSLENPVKVMRYLRRIETLLSRSK